MIPWEILRNWAAARADAGRAPILMGHGKAGLELLLALAIELDERGGWWPDQDSAATTTGERVCRACGGRGERIVALDQGLFTNPDIMRAAGRFDETEDRLVPDTRIVVERCSCDGPTRPDTVSLAWLVQRLVALGSPRCPTDSLPELWQVRLDQAMDAGDTSWQATWWRCFVEWLAAGKVPDPAELAPHLRAMTPVRPRELDGLAVEIAGGLYGVESMDWADDSESTIRMDLRSDDYQRLTASLGYRLENIIGVRAMVFDADGPQIIGVVEVEGSVVTRNKDGIRLTLTVHRLPNMGVG